MRVGRLHGRDEGRRAFLGGEGLQPTAPRRPSDQPDGDQIVTDGPSPRRRSSSAASTCSVREPRRGDRLSAEDSDAGGKVGPPRHGLRGRWLRRAHARSGGAAVGAGRGRRPPVPRGVGTGGRGAHPRARRLRPRRGGGAGRLPRRPRGPGRPVAAAPRPRGSRPPPGTRRSTASAGLAGSRTRCRSSKRSRRRTRRTRWTRWTTAPSRTTGCA